ncbi:uncharacterized protein COLE_01667 [Cutaneotrichosporon oleaginosum]|uniref:uncharacterized protein n=1 Tax=Cutaneotrichosporon oleaginosum TaxID=879819 RepID=UPI00132A4108|nr:hypothetical protein COLE_01667 [Cutaneotrichosporon oleaginosum]
MPETRAQSVVKAFAKKNEPVLDEKAGMPAPTPTSAPPPVAEIRPAVEPTDAKEDKKEPETLETSEGTDEKPKFNLRALFAPKKKPAESPAEAETAQSADPFAAQTKDAVTTEAQAQPAEASAVAAADTPVEADTATEAAPATEEGEKKKGLARIFSLKRKRAVDSAAPSTTEAEPATEVSASEVAATETTPAAEAATETSALQPPSEAESKRASWKRLRLSRTMSGTPKEDEEVKLARTQSPIIEATAETLGAVNAEPVEEKKEKKLWSFGRKDEVVAEPEAVKPADAAAPVETSEKKDDAPAVPPKPTVWKRFMSISKIPEPEQKKEEDKINKPEEATPAPEAPAVTPATDPPVSESPAVAAESHPATESPAAEKKGFFVNFTRKSPKAEATDTSATPLAPEAKVEDAEAAAPSSAAAPETEAPEQKTSGLYRIFSGRRKNTKAEPSAPSVQAETVPAETTEGKDGAKEDCTCPTPKEEAPATESSISGLLRFFSPRESSPREAASAAAVPSETAPKAEADPETPATAPIAEATADTAVEVLKDDTRKVPSEETPKVWKRLLSVRRKPSASPEAETSVPAAAAAAPAPFTEAAVTPAEEVKDEKAGLVTRLRALVPNKEKAAVTEPPVTEASTETAEKTEKPSVVARVASALSLTRAKSPTPAETAPAAEEAKPDEAAPSTTAKAVTFEEPATVETAAPDATPVSAAAAPADAPKA